MTPDDRANLTHFNHRGEAHMVDVGAKAVTRRRAVARGRIAMAAATLQLVATGGHAKGDVFGIARTAGILAAKQTAALIPLCHALPLTHVHIEFVVTDTRDGVWCTTTAETTARTGVEMEALTAVQIALLTIYDMCKAVDRGMMMHEIGLLHKSGGQTGDWSRTEL